ncbi:MAG TPA: hypothetical protein DCY74_06685, partial [Clostridiales bacterium]|nr:hypothetical protein [Clostridiales bacterium]
MKRFFYGCLILILLGSFCMPFPVSAKNVLTKKQEYTLSGVPENTNRNNDAPPPDKDKKEGWKATAVYGSFALLFLFPLFIFLMETVGKKNVSPNTVVLLFILFLLAGAGCTYCQVVFFTRSWMRFLLLVYWMGGILYFIQMRKK